MRIPAFLRVLPLALGLLAGCAHSSNPFYQITVTLDPAAATLAPLATQRFTATASGSAQGVTWAVQESHGGTVTSAGLYTAPAVTGTFHLVATSLENHEKSGTATIQVVEPAQITQFTATPALVLPGAPVVLQGVFSGGSGSLTPGGLGMTSGQSVTVNPTQDTTYTLTVTSPAGAAQSVTATATVRVAVAPVIQGFLASTPAVVQGGGLTLTPTFTGGAGVITPEVGAVTSGTAYMVNPSQTTTYVLTLTGDLGVQVARTVQVEVFPPIQISSFGASPALSLPGTPVLLQPVFTGGSGVITPGVGAVTSGQSYAVTPAATTDYTLTVTSPAGPVQSLTIPVTRALPPVIESFLASTTTVVEGASLTLTPRFHAGSGVLSPGVGAVASGTPYDVSPTQTTTYTLTVTGDLDAQVVSSLRVTVVPQLQITSFEATPNPSFPGSPVLLQPVFAGGTGILTPDIGAVTSGQSYPVAPMTPTLYTLTVTGPQGAQLQATAQVRVRAHGSFAATGPVGTPRKYHTATRLVDDSVLITGGLPLDDATASMAVLNHAERFDPASGTFAPVGVMAVRRMGHAAVRLTNGQVLITGGSFQWHPLATTDSAELWDPASGQFTPLAAPMTVGRRNHTATLLADGQVLLCGGLIDLPDARVAVLSSAERFDPVTGTFTALPAMTAARQSHQALALPDGTVLLLGGVAFDALGLPFGIAEAERFIPGATPAFVATASALGTGRGLTSATLLPDGRVLVAGGLGPGGTWVQSTEFYTPATQRFELSAPLTQPLLTPVAALLANGQVAIFGQGDTEVFAPAGPTVANLPGLGSPTQSGLTATPLATGKVLLLNLEGATLFDPVNP